MCNMSIDNLPNITNLQKEALSLSPDFLSINLPHDSTIPLASVCFMDAIQSLQECRYALIKAITDKRKYEEESNIETSIFMQRFYYSDLAFRLYSSAEDVATAVINMLEIKDDVLSPYRKKYTSLQRIIGNYLIEKEENASVTKSILKLRNSTDWGKAMDYRNACVHEQHPTLQGEGMVYKRAIKWKISGKKATLSVGGGDVPDTAIEEIGNFLYPAFLLFTEEIKNIFMCYKNILINKGAITKHSI